jgi:hypothetical protein
MLRPELELVFMHDQLLDIEATEKTSLGGRMDDSVAPARLAPLDFAFLGLLALMVTCHLVAARLAAGPITAVLTDMLAVVYLLALISRSAWRPLVLRLMLLGLVVGILELFTDAAGESVAHSLVYAVGGPMIWASPLYMSFSWMIVLTLLGYLGWRLRGLLPLWLAIAITGLWGSLNIPFYEETAYYAGWWHYTTTLRIGHTPIYVLLFEGLIAAALPLLTSRFPRVAWRTVVWRGVMLGAWMPVAAFCSWQLLGR